MFAAVRWRQKLVSNLAGDILEIGVGAGENLPYYRRADQVFAIEPDPARAQQAQAVAQNARLPITVDVAPAEELPYPDSRFDHVVSSLVLCSVHDQHTALNEIRRVLKPGGVLHMVEHVRPQNEVTNNFFRILTPWWRKVACNCHLDRPTLAVLQESGWDAEVHNRLFMFVKLSAVPTPEPRHSARKTGSEEEFYRQAYAGQAAE